MKLIEINTLWPKKNGRNSNCQDTRIAVGDLKMRNESRWKEAE